MKRLSPQQIIHQTYRICYCPSFVAMICQYGDEYAQRERRKLNQNEHKADNIKISPNYNVPIPYIPLLLTISANMTAKFFIVNIKFRVCSNGNTILSLYASGKGPTLNATLVGTLLLLFLPC